jgi:zinc transport system substrate-binding protein
MIQICKVFSLVIVILLFALEVSADVDVFVSILPQKNFVEKVGNGRVHVHVLVPPGHSPATYAPTPGQMAALSRSDIYFSIGVPFERGLLSKIINNDDFPEVIDMSEGVRRKLMSGGELDPHVWLAPANVMVMADNICNALSRLDPTRL